MPLEDLLETATSWLVKGGAVFLALTLVAFIAKWGLRFRLVGVTSFTFVLAISCWALASVTPPPSASRAPSGHLWCSTTAMI